MIIDLKYLTEKDKEKVIKELAYYILSLRLIK